MSPLRIALFGQAPLAIDCLDRLREAGHTIVAVFAPPDGGRPDPLAAHGRALGLHVQQRRFFQRKDGTPIPAALRDYAGLDAELNVLASLTAFLPSAITDAPRHKSLCFHPSLLPRFRGGNALQWQILSGESETGVSIFVPDAGVDTGPIAVQKGGVRIEPGDTTASLFFEKLAPLGAQAIAEAVARIDKGDADPLPQDESRATFQPLVDDRVAAIDLARPAVEIDRLARGCDPQPGAFVRWRGAPVRVYATQLGPELPGEPGQIHSIDAEGVTIALRGGSLCIGRARADQGKEPAQAWALRTQLRVGDRVQSG